MELEEMKNIWNDLSQQTAKQMSLTDQNILKITQVKYKKQASLFRIWETVGLLLAYAIVGAILYTINELDAWYLDACAVIMIIYLLAMPLYTFTVVRKMKKIDLAKFSYKEVLDQFYSAKKGLRLAEMVSFIASPLLFVASLAILLKIFTGKDLFMLSLQLPIIVFIAIVFTGVILFNNWAFKKRRKHLRSVEELLEEAS